MTVLPTSVMVDVTVNGRPYSRTVPARQLLTDFLREELGLTGTHVGCEHGVCGACNVLVDGVLVRWLPHARRAGHGPAVTTIEGVTADGQLHPVQQALLDETALQCGFCTPGVVMTLVDLLTRPTTLSDDELREELSGNLCRCTGYAGILAAARVVMASGIVERAEREKSE